MSGEIREEARRPRLRFSLLTLLLLTTIVALSVVVWRLGSKIEPMRQEVRRVREDNGFLTIEDPTKIHAIALRELQSRKWTYRVYLPPGRNYFVACKINDLPLGGELPRMRNPPPLLGGMAENGNRRAMGLAPGEYLITLALFIDDKRDWQYRLNCRSSSFAIDGERRDRTGGGSLTDGELRDFLRGSSFSTDDQWPNREGAFSAGGVSKQMSVATPDKPIMLLDGRAFGDEVQSSDKSTEGAVLWIEPIP